MVQIANERTYLLGDRRQNHDRQSSPQSIFCCCGMLGLCLLLYSSFFLYNIYAFCCAPAPLNQQIEGRLLPTLQDEKGGKSGHGKPGRNQEYIKESDLAAGAASDSPDEYGSDRNESNSGHGKSDIREDYLALPDSPIRGDSPISSTKGRRVPTEPTPISYLYGIGADNKRQSLWNWKRYYYSNGLWEWCRLLRKSHTVEDKVQHEYVFPGDPESDSFQDEKGGKSGHGKAGSHTVRHTESKPHYVFT